MNQKKKKKKLLVHLIQKKKEKIHRVRMSVLYAGLLLSVVLILCRCCDLVS